MLKIHDTVKDVGGQPSVNENSVSNDNGNKNAINTLINAEVECDNKMNEGNNGNCSVYIDNFKIDLSKNIVIILKKKMLMRIMIV